MENEEYNVGDFVTLTDEDGVESEYELIGETEVDGDTYYALAPNDTDDEYVILKLERDEDGEAVLSTITDDDEFDRVAEIFDDELFSDIDYDEDEGGDGN